MPASSHQEVRTSQESVLLGEDEATRICGGINLTTPASSSGKHGPYPFLPTKPGLSAVCNYYEC